MRRDPPRHNKTATRNVTYRCCRTSSGVHVWRLESIEGQMLEEPLRGGRRCEEYISASEFDVGDVLLVERTVKTMVR